MGITTAKAAKGVMVFTADAIGLLRDIQDQVYRQVRQRALERAAADNRELVTAEDIAAEIGPVLRDLRADASGAEVGRTERVVGATMAQVEAFLRGKQQEAAISVEPPKTGAPNAAADNLSRDR
jgi:hypothetical protein